MNRQFWSLPIDYMGLFWFSLHFFSLFCSGNHTLCAKRNQRQEQHFDPQISLQFSTAELSGPCLHISCFSYCSAQQQPDLVAASQVQHSPLSRRRSPSSCRTPPWQHTDNYLQHRRERGEKTSAVGERLFHKHLQVSFINRRLLQGSSGLAGKTPQIQFPLTLPSATVGTQSEIQINFHTIPFCAPKQNLLHNCVYLGHFSIVCFCKENRWFASGENS